MSPRGVALAVGAYGIWGLLPAYWKALAAVSADEILAHRVLGTVVVAVLLLAASRRFGEVADALRRRRDRRALLASGSLIGANWLVYIWAVNSERLLEASFGYYLNPLLSVLLGVVALGERLSRPQGLAVALAACGVAVLGAHYGGLPWIPLFLAASFALYGLVHKLCAVRPVPALALETALLAPAAALWLGARGGGAWAEVGAAERALLSGAGLATAIPLLCFGAAAHRLPLSALGLFQYLAPTLGFALAVFAYGEPFTRAHAIAFACIWGALALFSADAFRRRRGSEGPPPAVGLRP